MSKVNRLVFCGLFVGVVALVAGCSGEKVSANVEVIDILNFKERPWSELPSDVITPEYIRLSSEGDSILLGNVDDIKMAAGKIYVRDWKNKRIAIFGMDGTGQKSLMRYGRGPGEYLNVSEFEVDSTGNIYVVDGTSDRILVYNAELNLVRETKPPFEIDLFKVIDPNRYLLVLSSWEKGALGGTQLLLCDSMYQVTKQVSKYTEYVDDNFWLSSRYFAETEKGIFYQQSVNDSVYFFNRSGELQQMYLFDFGRYTIPLEKRKNMEACWHSGELKNYSTLVMFTVIGERYIYGSLKDKGGNVMFIADKEARSIYKMPCKESGKYGIFTGCSAGKIISYIVPGVKDAALPEAGDDFLIGLYKIK